MKIEKVILQNIGVYVNKNEFDLQSDKPIILIGGMNGRGKTTFLDSILFVLYGRRALDSSQNLERHLHKISNISGICTECFIELHFSVQEQAGLAHYSVKRFWDIGRKHPLMKTAVQKNGEEKPVLSQNWDMFVEEILPRAIAPFFFFDGERIAELAATENNTHLQSAIRDLLGLDLIDQLVADLHAVSASYQRKLHKSSYRQELEDMEELLRENEKSLQVKYREVERLKNRIEQLKAEKAEIENEFLEAGGDYARQRDQFKEQKRQIEEQMKKNQDQLLELAASSFPLKLADSLLKDIKTAAENEKEQSEMRIFLDQFSKLYDRYFQKKEPGPELQGLLENVKRQVRSEESIYGLDRDDLSHLEEIPGVLEEESRQCEMLLEEKRRLDRKLEEINNYLAVKVEDMQIEMIHQRLAENGYQIGQAEAGLQIAEEEYGLLNSRKESLEKSREQILWKVVREEEESDENRRMISYAQMQTEIMKKYKDELQALKADDLAAQMTECFGRIIAKEGLIQKIQIDHKTLEFSYYNKNGRRVEHQMLSSGEKQILVIAMLWALGICSKAEFPLIIDTPLGRLDSIHRTSLIENYFPKASEQVIILSTDQEITDKDYQALKKYVGKEYTLVYDTETMSSSIRSGYFGGKRI